MQRPLFVIEEVIPKLKEWALNNKDAIMILQDPQWKEHYSVMQKASNVKVLVVENSSLKAIFRDQRVASKEETSAPMLKKVIKDGNDGE
ncbi:hypothetical protein K1719_016783 [Acacia pycnantha]|nr:hypothetical protein K1719_016783 [Acacia pycnantha]